MIFRRITLPLIAPMLASVFLLVFASSLRDVSTVVLIATPGTRTLALLMFDFTLSGQLESATVIGVIIAVICLIVTSASLKIRNSVGIQR
jgi:iron(III) transport system permease protein